MKRKAVLFCMAMMVSISATGCGSSSKSTADDSALTPIIVYRSETTNGDDPYISVEPELEGKKLLGTYCISTEKGLLCSGLAFNSREDAVANPIEINGMGNNVVATLAYKDISDARIIKPGESQHITIQGWSGVASLYVVNVDET